MVNANEFGFLPENDGDLNAKNLQKAVDMGGEIYVERAGVYDLAEPIELGDDTALIFGAGITVRRQPSKTGVNGNAFINKGAFARKVNRNIKLIGLKLVCNGVESTGVGIKSRMVGLRAQVAFIYVENLEVKDFECTGLVQKDYGLQVCAFENIRLENLFIAGNKDGVHLGWGKGFVIRNGKFCTYDDPIALNAYDYSVSNTHVGWIENGLIENCYDLADDTTTGYFCRILGGAWCAWHKGMLVHHSDTVTHNGRIYRVVMNPTDGKLYPSNTPPTHADGVKEYDGINWVMCREGEDLDCGVRNVHLKNIYLEKKRNIGISFDLNYDTYARSYYVGCKPVPQTDVTFENVHIQADISCFVRANYPTGTVKIVNTDLKDSKVRFEGMEIEGLEYPEATLILENVTRKEDSIFSDVKHKVKIK